MRLAPERESQRICESKNLGHGVVPTVFWGKRDFARGRREFPSKDSFTALNLMGDWCGPMPTPND
jgi:hypothetical protein